MPDQLSVTEQLLYSTVRLRCLGRRGADSMRRIANIVAILVLTAAPAWAGYQAGLNAYKRGDYTTALKELRPLAEQGDVRAQFNLGLMYGKGEGVPQDYAEAAKWYLKAAERGYASAQSILGVTYGIGEGVPQDYVQAHMWFNLAVAQGDERARDGREIVEEFMAPDQISEAQRLAREWKPEVATTEQAGGRFGVQLGAYHLPDLADIAWNQLRAAHPDLLGDLGAAIMYTDLGTEEAAINRLVAGVFETKTEAQELCARLKQRNVDCFVPRP